MNALRPLTPIYAVLFMSFVSAGAWAGDAPGYGAEPRQAERADRGQTPGRGPANPQHAAAGGNATPQRGAAAKTAAGIPHSDARRASHTVSGGPQARRGGGRVSGAVRNLTSRSAGAVLAGERARNWQSVGNSNAAASIMARPVTTARLPTANAPLSGQPDARLKAATEIGAIGGPQMPSRSFLGGPANSRTTNMMSIDGRAVRRRL